MDKKIIEFLIKNGFTIEEIMNMDSPAPAEEQKQEEPVETPKQENISNSFEKMLTDFKKELSDMREEIHKQNRQQTIIEPKPVEQLSFEEDIEKMIEEVTK